MNGKHALALVAALGATGVEVFCVYDGLRDATGAQLAAGVAIAILAPLVPAYIEGARRYFATIVFVFALACVIIASGSRVGASVDHAQQQRDQAARASKLAAQSERELSEMLAEARKSQTAQATACPKPTKACTEGAKDAQKRVDGLQTKLQAARTTLTSAPTVAGEGDVARIAAWTGGFLTEHQVSLYLPLLWPVTMALVGAFFWGVWGDTRASTSVSSPNPPQVELAPKPTPAISSGDNVLAVLKDVLEPGPRKSRVEIAQAFDAYTRTCAARGLPVAPAGAFGDGLQQFAEAAGLRTLTLGNKVFLVGVKLAA